MHKAGVHRLGLRALSWRRSELEHQVLPHPTAPPSARSGRRDPCDRGSHAPGTPRCVANGFCDDPAERSGAGSGSDVHQPEPVIAPAGDREHPASVLPAVRCLRPRGVGRVRRDRGHDPRTRASQPPSSTRSGVSATRETRGRRNVRGGARMYGRRPSLSDLLRRASGRHGRQSTPQREILMCAWTRSATWSWPGPAIRGLNTGVRVTLSSIPARMSMSECRVALRPSSLRRGV